LTGDESLITIPRYGQTEGASAPGWTSARGCLLCIEACPQKLLQPGKTLNRLGYHPVTFIADGRCTGCGLCYYACPEPDAIAVAPCGEESAA
jgi:NAD-dependent dihydropyrimidine dehydrogenase PreA subunit